MTLLEAQKVAKHFGNLFSAAFQEAELKASFSSKTLILLGLILFAASVTFAGDMGQRIQETTCKLIGKVTDARTGEGLPGAKVNVLGTIIEATTDSGGSYEIQNLSWKTFTVRASKSGYTDGPAFHVRVIGGMTTRQDFNLRDTVLVQNWDELSPVRQTGTKPKQGQPNEKATGMILGKVMDVKTGEGLLGAKIGIVGTTISTSSNVDGIYTIPNVPEGTYTLKASEIGFEDTTKTGIRVIGGQTTTQDFIFGTRYSHGGIYLNNRSEKGPKQEKPNEKETGKIIVKVIDAKAKEGISGASVTLIGTKYLTYPDMYGHYYIDQVPPGTYVLSVEALGFTKQEMIEITVVKEKTTVKTFYLEPIITHPPY